MYAIRSYYETLTVTQIGKVKNKHIAIKAHEAKNLPHMMVKVDIGNVIINSIVPFFRSSAHNRIDTAGISIKYIHGRNNFV